MKKMVNGVKKRNQSEDIKIDYPGLSNMKQKYDANLDLITTKSKFTTLKLLLLSYFTGFS